MTKKCYSPEKQHNYASLVEFFSFEFAVQSVKGGNAFISVTANE